jgi:hypothetical protein
MVMEASLHNTDHLTHRHTVCRSASMLWRLLGAQVSKLT